MSFFSRELDGFSLDLYLNKAAFWSRNGDTSYDYVFVMTWYFARQLKIKVKPEDVCSLLFDYKHFIDRKVNDQINIVLITLGDSKDGVST